MQLVLRNVQVNFFMSNADQFKAKELADWYDTEAEAMNWRGPEVTFGMVYSSLEPGQSILDLGIGTGLSAELFHRVGLRVTGMDFSNSMLDAVAQKGITEQLVQHGLESFPYPFEGHAFHHVTSIGVFNFFEDLEPIFKEVRRVLIPQGTFSFIVGDTQTGVEEFKVTDKHSHDKAAVGMYRHSREQIHRLFDEVGMKELRNLEFNAYMDRDHKEIFKLRCYVAIQA